MNNNTTTSLPISSKKTKKKHVLKTPELRFSHFDDDWSDVKLKDITSRKKRKNTNLDSNLVLTISAEHGLIDQEKYFNKSVAGKNLKNYYLLEKGDFAYNKSYSNGYPYGVVKKLNQYDKGIVSNLYICFKPNENINSTYLEQYFNSSKWNKEVYKIATEGARNHGLLNVGINDFFNTKHKIPIIQEQEKIGNFLKEIDTKIALMEQKQQELEKFKTGLFQIFFNMNSNNKWMNYKIKDCIVESTTRNKNKNNFPVISSTLNGIYLQEEYFNKSVSSSETDNYKIIKKGYFTYRSMSDTGRFKFNIQDIEDIAIVSPAYPVFGVKKFIDPLFFYYYLNHAPFIRKQLLYIKEGGTRYALSISKFKKMSVKIPDLPEQKRIVDILSSTDKKIELTNRTNERL